MESTDHRAVRRRGGLCRGGRERQVEAGAPLVRIRAARRRAPTQRTPVALAGLEATVPPGTPPCERVYAALRGYLLGYDLDPATVREMLARQRGSARPPRRPIPACCAARTASWTCSPRSARCTGRAAETEPEDALTAGGTQEYLLSYLQWLDADRAGLPDDYRRRLEQALQRYGVEGLERTAALEEAVVWMFRSFRRVAELVPAITGDPRAAAAPPARARRRWPTRTCAPGSTGCPRRPRAATRSSPNWPGRAVPLPGRATAVRRGGRGVQPRRAATSTRCAADPDGRRPARTRGPAGRLPAAAARGAAAPLADRRRPGLRRALLEIYTRRFYRIRELREFGSPNADGWQLCIADYDLDDKRIHLVTAYAPAGRTARAGPGRGRHLRTADPTARPRDIAACDLGDLPARRDTADAATRSRPRSTSCSAAAGSAGRCGAWTSR